MKTLEHNKTVRYTHGATKICEYDLLTKLLKGSRHF